MKKILLLEDNIIDIDLISRKIKSYWPDVDLVVVSRIADARKLLMGEEIFDIALFDLKLPDGDGMSLLIDLRLNKYSSPIIILTASGSEELAISALKSGANDYISKKPGFYKKIPQHIEFTLKQVRENQQSLKVLYAEHHKSDADLTYRYLKQHAPHIHLTQVFTGDEVLEHLSNNRNAICDYDVLMLDYNLSGLNALEISKQIRQEQKLSIAIVIVTGHGDEDAAVEALKIGVDDYIVKHKNYLFRLPSVLTSAYRRRELERQQIIIKKSEERFKRLFESLGDAVYVTQIGGKNIGDILEVNPAAIKQSGYSRNELLKMNIIRDLAVLNSGTEISSEDSDNKLLSGKTVSYVEKKRRKNGEEYWTEIIITPIEFKGHLAGLSINRDITDRKIQEEKLTIALDAAKEADRIKTAFLANMSHELRTPLNAIIGFSDLIDINTDPEDSAEFAKHINRSGLSLLDIVDEIFEVTLIERGQLSINKTQKPVYVFIDDIYQTVLNRQKNLGLSKVIIEKEMNGIDQYTIAFTDFNILRQVFIALLSNALKFTSEGFIRFGVFSSENKNELVFFVKDTGIGIPKEMYEKIFERFRIGDESRTRKYSGIGIGLYISYRLINILGGKIWVESELGKGSTFYFSIP
ncbi:MAG: hypothetical protein DRI74_01800 [Bacteroidetes bacterium]|nr:MAG: hypothetical protein DRI74_01800 [Bacteroidota bacterium]